MKFNSRSDLENFCKDLECIGHNCYLIDNRYVLKVLDKSYVDEFDVDKNSILKFKGLNIFGVANTLDVVTDEDSNVIGCINQYVRGKNGEDNYFSSISIDKLISDVNKLSASIKNISDMGIIISDPYNGNIIYNDSDGFTFIDTLEWYYSEDSKEDIYTYNMIQVMYELIGSVFGFTLFQTYSITSYLKFIDSKFKNWEDVDDYLLLSPSKLINDVRIELEDEIGFKIEKFSDVFDVLRDKFVFNTRLNEIYERISNKKR